MPTALLLVDIQNDYFPGGEMELFETSQAATQARRLLDHFRSTRQAVFHIQHLSLESDATFFKVDSNGVRINEIVSPAEGEQVVTKHSPNAFHATDLHDQLEMLGINHLVIAGMMSHMCIDSTARAASDLGFECTVASDACTTRELTFNRVTVDATDVHSAFMAGLAQAFASVQSVDEYIQVSTK